MASMLPALAASEVIDGGDTVTVPSLSHPSPWDITGSLIVGGTGVGTLNVESAGEVTSTEGVIAQGSTSTGMVTVKDAESIWDLGTNSLYVGFSGGGTLNIEAGGKVTSGDSFIGYNAESTSTATVTGENSIWDLGSRSLSVGFSGTGTLNVENGGKVTSAQGYLGVQPDSSGTATVTGENSVWDLGASALSVGYGGEGTLNIEAGGSVTSGEGVLGQSDNSTGTATVTGENSTWNLGANALYVGLSGGGTLNVEASGKVTSGDGFIGYNTSSNSTATVTGENSTWDLGSHSLSIGYSGTGELRIESGGKVTSGYSNIAVGSDSIGTVTVTGQGSTWNLGDQILGVGYEGNGTLNIEASGTVESGAGVIGYNADSIGAATVTGTGSSWNTGSEYLYVGQFGTGTLTIEEGGEVSSAKTFIGNEANSSGTLNLDGDENGRGVLATAKIIKGAGTATLNIDGGVLKATDDEVDFLSGFAAGDIQIKAGGAFIDTNGYDVDVDATLEGDGILTKQGVGTLTLTGDSSTFDGSTQVLAGILSVSSESGTSAGVLGGAVSVSSGGTLLVEGGTINGLVTLGNGGLLGGNGTIGGLVVDTGGVVAPGNSPGTIAVNGAVAFNDGSTYRVDVAADGQHDLIAATGTVTLSGGASVEVLASPGVYDWHTTYTILSTEATVDGTFGSVTSDYAFLIPSLSYDDQNVYLTLVKSDVPFDSFARTPNQAGVAVAAQALGLGNKVYDAILGLPKWAVAGAFNALSGEVYASADTVIQQQSIYVRDAVGARLRQSVTAAAAEPLAYATKAPATAQFGADYAPTLWAQGYGGWGNTSGNSDVASLSNTIGGFLMGADVAVADNARAGLFGGYSRSTFDVDARSSSGDMDNYDIGLYAGARFDALAVSGGVAYSWHDVTVDRTVAFPGFAEALNADYSNGSLQVFGELGYAMTFGAVDVEPFVGAAYLNIDGARFSETGGAAALAVSTASMETTYTTVGLRAATTVAVQGHVLTPNLTLGWQHAFGDTTPAATMLFSGGTLPFQVWGVPIAEDAMLLQAGIGYALSDMAVLSASYSGQLASSASQNAFTAQFALKF